MYRRTSASGHLSAIMAFLFCSGGHLHSCLDLFTTPTFLCPQAVCYLVWSYNNSGPKNYSTLLFVKSRGRRPRGCGTTFHGLAG